MLVMTGVRAQSGHYIDDRLREAFPQEYLNYLQANEPQELAFLNWCLDNSYSIIEMPGDKSRNLEYLYYYDHQTKTVGNRVEDIDTNELVNILKFNYQRDMRRTVVYKIGDSGKVISFAGNNDLTNDFNRHYHGTK